MSTLYELTFATALASLLAKHDGPVFKYDENGCAGLTNEAENDIVYAAEVLAERVSRALAESGTDSDNGVHVLPAAPETFMVDWFSTVEPPYVGSWRVNGPVLGWHVTRYGRTIPIVPGYLDGEDDHWCVLFPDGTVSGVQWHADKDGAAYGRKTWASLESFRRDTTAGRQKRMEVEMKKREVWRAEAKLRWAAQKEEGR